MARSIILSKVKHIYMWDWTTGDTPPGEIKILSSASDSKRMELLDIVADTVAITQDDTTSESTESETRDEPIIETVTLGKYNITMDSADISFDILEKCLGFSKIGEVAAAAPASYIKKFVAIAIGFDDQTLLLPKILLTSRIDASTLKTGIARGTLSGSAYSAKITVGVNPAVDTPFLVINNDQSVTIANLGASDGGSRAAGDIPSSRSSRSNGGNF